MIVVTGATGTVGREVVRELQQAGEPVAALVRNRERAAAILGAEVELREGDLTRPETLAAVFAGAERVFLAAPLVPELSELEAATVDAAAEAGVQQVVKLSTAGVTQTGDGGRPEPRQYPLHRHSEQRLEQSGAVGRFGARSVEHGFARLDQSGRCSPGRAPPFALPDVEQAANSKQSAAQ